MLKYVKKYVDNTIGWITTGIGITAGLYIGDKIFNRKNKEKTSTETEAQ